MINMQTFFGSSGDDGGVGYEVDMKIERVQHAAIYRKQGVK